MFLIIASIMLLPIGIAAQNAFADQVVATIPVSGAWGVATNSNTKMTYVASGNSYQVQVINDRTNTVVATVTTASVPSGSYSCFTYTVTVNPLTNIIYTNNNACVYKQPSMPSHWIY